MPVQFFKRHMGTRVDMYMYCYIHITQIHIHMLKCWGTSFYLSKRACLELCYVVVGWVNIRVSDCCSSGDTQDLTIGVFLTPSPLHLREGI